MLSAPHWEGEISRVPDPGAVLFQLRHSTTAKYNHVKCLLSSPEKSTPLVLLHPKTISGQIDRAAGGLTLDKKTIDPVT
jgi:hypothetical protein